MLKKYDWSDLTNLYLNQKLTARQIADIQGSSVAGVCYMLHRLGIQPRGPTKYSNIDKETLSELYWKQEKTSGEIGQILNISQPTVCHLIRKFNLPRRSMSESLILYHKHNPQLNKPPKINSSGYRLLYAPQHPRATKQYKAQSRGSLTGYVYEHILVWEETHQRPLPKGWVIHHINGIKTDNRPENLVAYPGNKHQEVIPKMALRIRQLEIENRQLRRALEDSQTIFYIGEN